MSIGFVSNPHMSRLKNSTASYLKHSSTQPVNWFEHTPGAFSEAQRLNRPILVDIGAIWCHWCHVMDFENYHDPEIARIINKNFIPIKIDRDHSPDLDNYYQTIVGQLAGRGGWPLTVFLTEDGYPFFGGTYYPKEDRPGLPGFKSVLKQITKTYFNKRDSIRKQAHKNTAIIKKLFQPDQTEISAKSQKERSEIQQKVMHDLIQDFDRQCGGFGNAPKFPPYTKLNYLIEKAATNNHDQKISSIIDLTLTKMAQGGIYDHLQGGFHRYATDRNWHVPHFEKMLYDNALLLENYLDAYKINPNPLYRQICHGIISYTLENLADEKNGCFAASQDADQTVPDDGTYFTWTQAEINQLLNTDELAVAQRYFDIDYLGDLPHRQYQNVLRIAKTHQEIAKETGFDLEKVNSLLNSSLQKMTTERNKRKVPFIDRTIYTGWNALMIKSLFKAGRIFKNQRWLEFSRKSLERILREARLKNGSYAHSLDNNAESFLDDNAYLLETLLEFYKFDPAPKYLQAALNLLKSIERTFWNKKIGLFQLTAKKSQIAPQFPILDQPLPAANPVMVLNYIQLSQIVEKQNYIPKAVQIIDSAYNTAHKFSNHAHTFWRVLEKAREPLKNYVV